MTNIPFTKYHGTGNDFIMIDDRTGQWLEMINESWVAKICHRHFGIGADGLIVLQPGKEGADFFMKYYNSDGRTSTFCGNGGRCIISFSGNLGIHNGECKFLGTDGWHEGSVNHDGLVHLTMTDVNKVVRLDEKTYLLDTGSPHYVTFVEDVESLNVPVEGKLIRNSVPFKAEGINVNFVQSLGPSELRMRTYERGVENETMACGTGVVAAAIANALHRKDQSGHATVHVAGGTLQVEFKISGTDHFTEVKLIGPAVEVFRGEIELN